MSNQSSPRATAIVKAVFTLIGLLLLSIALYLVTNTRQFIATALFTEGTVIGLSESSDDDGITYYPIVRFTSRNDRESEFVSNIGSSPPSFEVGDTVEVAYLADDVSSARINTFGQLWTIPLILGFIGVIFSSISLGLWLSKTNG